MPLNARATGKIEGYADKFYSGTVEMNFPPQPAFASVWLVQTGERDDDGWGAVGIRSIEYRDRPDGPNNTWDFGILPWDWPATWWHPLMTRVTFSVDVYRYYCVGAFAVDFWS